MFLVILQQHSLGMEWHNAHFVTSPIQVVRYNQVIVGHQPFKLNHIYLWSFTSHAIVIITITIHYNCLPYPTCSSNLFRDSKRNSVSSFQFLQYHFLNFQILNVAKIHQNEVVHRRKYRRINKSEHNWISQSTTWQMNE